MIRLDRIQFQEDLLWSTTPRQSDTREIHVYFMNNPDASAKIYRNDYRKYFELSSCLMNERLFKQVEFWIRQEDKQRNKFTPNGRYWVRAKPTSEIQRTSHTLTLDASEPPSQNEYTVAVLHDERDREIPMPLAIGKYGGDCCSPNCGDLRRHLEKLWDTRIVIRALRLSVDPEKCTCVFSNPLNDYSFDPDITELYLQCIPRPVPSTSSQLLLDHEDPRMQFEPSHS
ncbi:hypothetical protein CPB86DRAFT_791305 [Serendipita vermifera]|nr:hypothetical protein CPB86DRAFT_791305 [Serendipita vermifera]